MPNSEGWSTRIGPATLEVPGPMKEFALTDTNERSKTRKIKGSMVMQLDTADSIIDTASLPRVEVSGDCLTHKDTYDIHCRFNSEQMSAPVPIPLRCLPEGNSVLLIPKSTDGSANGTQRPRIAKHGVKLSIMKPVRGERNGEGKGQGQVQEFSGPAGNTDTDLVGEEPESGSEWGLSKACDR